MIWGIGHSLSSFVLGVLAFGILGNAGHLLDTLAPFQELAVGLSFLTIGSISLREAQKLGLGFHQYATRNANPMPEKTTDSNQKPDAMIGFSIEQEATNKGRMVLLNGIVHGMAIDGMPALIPALVFGTWRLASVFLLAYCGGTVVAMTGATIGLGECSQWLSQYSMEPELVLRRVSAASSLLAIGLGLTCASRGLASALPSMLALRGPATIFAR
jgi:hypothetical protein